MALPSQVRILVPPLTLLWVVVDGHDHLEVAHDGNGDHAQRITRLRGALVRFDSQPGLLAVARRLRRQLPGDERFGDPLSTAGSAPVQVVARGVSSLRPERDSVVHEVSLAGLQLWQSLSEATGRGRGGEPLALLFTDLVGFSSWALKAGRRGDARAAA